MSLDSLRDAIAKKAKGVHVSIMAESDLAVRDKSIPTPALDLNRILSGDLRKGLFEKTWTLIVGPEHSFKSSFMALTMARAQSEGYKVIIIDTEGAWDTKFIQRWGLNPEEVLYVYTPWVDEVKVILAQILESDEDKFAIVLDSVGGLDKKKILDDALAGDPKMDQGGLAKDLKPLYKLLLNVVKVKNSIAVAAGHYYGTPGAYGDAQEIAGGKALKLLPDVIISLKKSKMYDSDKHVVGNELKAITLKNRMYPPFNEATIQIDYVNGLNEFAGLAELAVKAGMVKKGGAGWYTYIKDDGSEVKAQGDEKLLKILTENKEEFIDKLNKWLADTGFSSINEELKAANDLVSQVIDND